MAIKVNSKGVSHAKSLIRQGKVDKESSWEFSAEDGNKILKEGWGEYAKWFLAIDTEANEETKEHYKFPYGKNGKVYRRGVIAAKQRAAQQGYKNIEEVADELLSMIDKDEKEEKILEEVIGRMQRRTFPVRKEAINEEAMTVSLSFSSETPVERWYGKEILLHDSNVNLKPLLECGAVLRNHNPDVPVAVPLEAWIDKEERKGKAIIKFVDTPESQRAFKEVKEGLIRGVSVGYIIRDYRFVRENETWNGINGPALVAMAWDVHEISLTPVPADINVGIGRNLERKEEEGMDEIIMNERQRVTEILTLCKEFDLPHDEAVKYVDEGLTVDEVRKRILERMKNVEKLGVKVVEDETDRFRRAAVEGILRRAGVQRQQAVEGADSFEKKSLLDIAKECLRRAGLPVSGDKMEIVKRAIFHTSSDFPVILQEAVNKSLLKGYDEFPSTYQTWTTKVSVSDFKTNTVINHGGFGQLPVVKEGAEYTYLNKFGEYQETYGIATYGAVFDITRQAIINDDLNVFNTIPKKLGQAAKRTIEMVVYSILTSNPTMGDGVSLFHSNHGNLGTAGAISETTLSEVRKMMGKQKDPSGIVIGLKPKYLIVPPAVWPTAALYMESPIFPGKSNNVPNIWRGFAQIIETVYVSADAGGTDTNYFFVADPAVIDGVWVAFLDGNDQPAVEREESFMTDGIAFKVRIDFGAKAVDYRALFKNAGA